MNPDFFKLMLVTHRNNTPAPDYLNFIKKCIGAGVTSVQLREKSLDSASILQFAYQLKELLITYNIPLIINDDPELALRVDASGVHLGQTDGEPQLARQKLGYSKCIGVSIETEEELQKANTLDLNYVAASAVFPSDHKKNLRTVWGLEGLHQLARQSRHSLIGIGGINEHNVADVIQAGAKGVAVIGALHQSKDPIGMALKLRNIIDRFTE